MRGTEKKIDNNDRDESWLHSDRKEMMLRLNEQTTPSRIA
jgi:hypothetical protein